MPVDERMAQNSDDYPSTSCQQNSTRVVFGSGAKLSLSDLREGVLVNEEENPDPPAEEDIWSSKDEILQLVEDYGAKEEKEEYIVAFKDMIPGMVCLREDGVWKRTLRSSDGTPVESRCTIHFHYNAYLDGKPIPFDASRLRREPEKIRMNETPLIFGLHIALMTMKEGEKAEILISPQYGLGEQGHLPRIPGNAYLLYVVEILNVFPESDVQDYENLSLEEVMEIPFEKIMEESYREKTSGNAHFKHGKYKEARLKYHKTIEFLEGYLKCTPEQEQQKNELLEKLYTNLASTYLRLRKPRSAMVPCRKAVILNPQNLKALFLYGRAKFEDNNLNEAKNYFDKCLMINPNSQEVQKELIKIEEKFREDEETSKRLSKKMGEAYLQMLTSASRD